MHIYLKDISMGGNWVANKTTIPFCVNGADYALEKVTRSMKVSGGLNEITLHQAMKCWNPQY